MRLLLIVVAVMLSSCIPVSVEEEYKTKYPEVPTMQSAEDANTGQLFRE
jgi:hypothetical protein